MSYEHLLADGQTIVFLGDSITQAANGYVSIVASMIGALAPDIRVNCINAGIGGHKVTDMLARVDKDVLAHDPDWVTLSVGVNDVWHGANGVPIDAFREKYDELVLRLVERVGANVVLFTTTVIGEDLRNEANARLVDYNNHIRETAKKRGLPLVDMNEVFHRAIGAWQGTGGGDLRFTTDGVHMRPEGDYLMALAVLRTWKLL